MQLVHARPLSNSARFRLLIQQVIAPARFALVVLLALACALGVTAPTVASAAPTASDNTVTTNEDTDYPFTAANFHFSGVNDGDTLASVLIVTLPSPDQGVLELDHAPVSANTRVSKAQLDANSLVYIPPANANGMDYANFTFKVSDGAADSASPNTMTITVAAVSDPPTASDSKVTTYENRDYTFTATDFSFADVDGDTLTSVRVVTLPKFGTGALQFNGGNIGPRHSISRKALDDGLITYRPPTNASGAGYASFTFTVHDDHLPSELTYTMTITVLPEVAPTASDNTVTTNEDTDYPFTAADFLFADADSADTLASVKIVTLPGLSKGLLKLDGEAVSASDIVTKTQLDARGLTYVPPTKASGMGYASFAFQVYDGHLFSASRYIMTITVLPDAPTARDGAVTATEDTDYPFTAANFHFSDDNDGDTLGSVLIVTLPAPDQGVLELDHAPVSANTRVSKAQLDANSLVYIPPANANGMDYANFTFKVSDGAADSASPNTMTITVAAVSDPPTASDSKVTTYENRDYTFTATDFSFADVDGDTLTSVRVVTLPKFGTGALQFNGGNIGPRHSISRKVLDAGLITYRPPTNASGAGYASFTFTVHDDHLPSELTYTMTITVLPEVAPTASDNTVTTNEDTDYPFTAADFLFADADSADTLASVKIVTLPGLSKGLLKLDGVDVSASNIVTKTQLDARHLTYVPPADANGVNYASFTFRVNDGAADSALLYTMTITVLPNVAPTASDNTVTTNEDTDYTFTADNFNFSDDNGRDMLASVSLVTLPANGVLKLDGAPANASAIVTKEQIDANNLVYAPPTNANGVGYASFTFTVKDDDGVSSALTYTMIITVTAVNDPPTTSDNTVTTNEDTDYTFSSADFNFFDVEGDGHGPGIGQGAVEIMSLPTHGTGVLHTYGTNISIGGLFARNNLESGDLAYTPPVDANGVGYASFTFRVEDSDGLTSPTYTMTITVLPNVAPTASDNTVTTNEDTDYTFTADNFNFSDKNDRDTLASVSLVTLPTVGKGTLRFRGRDSVVALTENTRIAKRDLDDGRLFYTPPTNANGVGYASFTFTVKDDDDLSSVLPYTMTITVTAVNDPPTASDNTVTTNEDTDYTFSSADFDFFDVEGDGHGIGQGAVEIMSLPTHGTGVLHTYGTNISIGDQFARNGLETEKLAYAPPADANGESYASFTFRVEDSDGLTSPTYTMTITVLPNVAPTASDNTVTTNEDTDYTFTADNFDFSDKNDRDTLASVSLVTLPANGVLKLDGAPANASAIVTREQIDANNLVYAPPADANGVNYASFTFRVNDGAADSALLYTMTITVLPNVAPTASDNTVTTNEDTDYTFTADNFNFSDKNDRDTLASVSLVTLPTVGKGTLRFRGRDSVVDLAANNRILKRDLDNGQLFYAPPANANGVGYASFTFTVKDDDGVSSALTYTMTITVTAVNDPPTTSDNTVTTNEDTDYTFSSADFNFFDVEGDGHGPGIGQGAVEIMSLPTHGTGVLHTYGTNISIGGLFARNNLESGDLAYTPPVDANGVGYASFTFRVEDSDGLTSPTYTMTITVLPNVAPKASDNTVTTNEDTDYTFTADNFNFSDKNDRDTLASVSVVTLPTVGKGTLRFRGRDSVVDLTKNTIIPKMDLDDGRLFYTPPTNANGVGYASFTFKVSDDDGLSSALPYTMTITVTAVNDPPTASDNTVTTNEDTDYTFTVDNFNFSGENDGDTLASVSLVTLPNVGTLKLDGSALTGAADITKTNLDDGHFTYAPPTNANGVGYASFTFKVSDGAADSASPNTMTITVTAVNDPPTGQPTISGTALVGQTLTADTSDIEDVDGLVGVSYGYQWIRVDGGTDTDISGETSSSYVLVDADIGKTIKVKATFTDDDGTAEMRTSVATGTVALPVVSVSGGMPVTEGTAATFTVTADPAPTSDITVAVTVTVTDSGVFAGGGQTGERTVIIQAGTTSATLTVTTLGDSTDQSNGAITAAVTGGTGYSAHNTAHTASVTVNDDDATAVMLTGLKGDVTEGDTKAFTVSLSRALVDGESLVAPLTLTGSATRGTDYTLDCASATGVACAGLNSGSATVTFTGSSSPTTATSMTITLAALADTTAELAETVVIGLDRPTATGLGGGATPTDTLADFSIVDPTPVAAFDLALHSASEDAGTHNVTVNLSPAVPHAGITLNYSVGGTATAGNGNDFTIANFGSVTVSAGATSVNIPVLIVDDSMDENAETVLLTLTPASGYTVGATSVHTLTINDNDDPLMNTPVVSVSGGMLVTEGTAATFTLTAVPRPTSDISVTVMVTDNGHRQWRLGAFASRGQTGTRMVTINTGGTATLTVTTFDDGPNGIDEPTGAITVAVTGGAGYSAHNTAHTASVPVNDDDDPSTGTPVVSVSGGPTVTEGTAATFTLTASPRPDSDITVTVTVTDSGAFAGGGQTGTKMVTINTNGTATLTVTTLGDTIDEPNGAITAAVTRGTGYSAHNTAHTAPVTVNDNDATALTLVGPKGNVTEGDTKEFTVSLDRGLVNGESLVAPLTLTGSATRGTDYTLACASATGVACAGLNSGTATVTFTGPNSGKTATSMTITLTALADTTAETAETVVIGLGTLRITGLDGGATPTATLADFSIVDPTPVADFDLDLHSASEDAGTRNVTVNLSPAAPHAGITLTYNVGGTATAGGGNDFTIANSGSVTLPVGATSVDIPVLIVDDSMDESAETVLLTLTAGSGYTVGAKSVHTLTINDATVVTLTGPKGDVTEGDTKAFTVSLSRALVDGESLAAPLTLAGTATRGTDYTLACASATGVACASLDSGDATVTFTGSSSPTTATSMTITLTALADTTAEPAETVVIGLGTPRATGLGGGATTTATLADFSIVDPTPVAAFDLGLQSASEDAGTRNVTVNLSPAAPHAGITLTYSVGGTATAGSGNDFTIANSGSVTLTVGATSVDIPVLIVNDNADENAETVILTLTPASGYTVGTTSVHTLTINDNDAAPMNTPVVSVSGGMAVTEGTAATFTLTADPAPDSDLLVTVMVTDSGAFAGGGQTGTKTVTIPADTTSAMLTVTTAVDTTDEPNGAITAAVTRGTGYSAHDTAHTASVTVNDDDATAVTLTGLADNITEGDTKAFTVNLNRALVDGESLVAPLTLNGTATRGTDYTLACASATGVACAGLDSGDATVTFTGPNSGKTATLMTITLTALADTTAEPTTETVVIGLDTPTATGLGGGAATTDTLADFSIVDPTPVADFDLDLRSASENAGTRNVTVNLSPAVPHAGITLTYSVGGTATAGSSNDFTIANFGSVTLPAGATSVNIPVLIVDDSMDESAETVLLTLTAGSGYTVGATSVHTLTINDNDAPPRGTPVVSVLGGRPVSEGTNATFTLTANPAPTGSDLAVTAMVTYSGAFAGGGGQTSEWTFTISAGNTSSMIFLATLPDAIDEPNGAVTAAVTRGTGYSVHNTAHTASVTINDNDATALTLTGPKGDVTEGDTKAFTVSLNRALVDGESLVAPLSITGSATRGTDYTLACANATGVACAGLNSGNATVTFTGSNSATTATSMTITLMAAADSAAEPAETVVIGLGTPTATSLGGGAETTDTLADFSIVDPTPVAAFELALRSASEDAGTRNVTVNLSPAQHSETTLNYSVGGTATAGSGNDFTIANSGSVTLSSGATSVDIPVLIVDDSMDENAETVLLTLTPASGYTVGATSVHTLTINDNDATALTLTGPADNITEGGTKAFTVSLSRALVDGESLVAPLSITGSATRGTDYTLACASATGVACAGLNSGSATVTFTGSSSPTTATSMTITLTAAADTTAEPTAETVVIGLGTPTATNLDGVAPTTDTLADFSIVDPTPVADFDLALHSASEDAGTHNVTVNLSPAAPHAGITLTYSVGGTATAGGGNDFTIANSGSVTLPSGATSVDIPVLIVNDNAAESAETVLLTLTPASGYTVGSTNVHTLTINDDDAAPMNTPVVSVSGGMSVTEGTAATFTLTASPAPDSNITVTVMVTDSGAFAGGGQTGTKMVTINTSGTATLTVTTADDTIDESNGAITAAVTGGTGYSTHNTTHTASVTINDNDAPAMNTPVVSVSGGMSVTEGTAATFTLTASPAPDSNITVTVMVTDSGAFAGGGQTGTKMVTINTSGTATLTVTTADDTIDESNGAITAAVTGGTGYSTHNTTHTASVTINDNDAPSTGTPVVSVSGGMAVTEGTAATFTLTASPAPNGDITVAVTVTVTDSGVFAGGGQAGTKMVTIPAGDTSATLTVTTADDTIDQSNGAITAAVTGGTGYSVHNTTHTASVTINDNDDPSTGTPVVSVSGGMAVTEGTAATFTLTASPAPDSDLSVTVTVTDSGAFAGGGQTGTKMVTINTSGTATLTVTTADDTIDEPYGAITAAVTGGTGYSAHNTTHTASVTINDNDDPSTGTSVVSVSGGMPVTEGRTATFTVTADPAPPAATSDITVAVTVTVTDSGVFTGGGQIGERTVIIHAGTTSAKLTVTTLGGGGDQSNGAITAAVTGGTGYSVHNTAHTASVTVNDNDATAVTLTGLKGDITEGDTKAFTVNLNRALVDGESLVAPLTLTGSATRGTDYTLDCASATGVACANLNSGSATVTFTGSSSPTTATSMTITLAALADTTAELAETVAIGLGTLTATGLGGGAKPIDNLADFNIVDPTPVAAFDVDVQSVSEGAGTHNVTVNLSPAVPHAGITLTYSVGGTATAGSSSNDFTIANSGSVTLPSGATSVDIPVLIVNDSMDENAETVILTLTPASGYTVGTTSVHTLTINDNDAPAMTIPVVSVSGGMAVTEGTDITFTLTAVPMPTSDITVTVMVTDRDRFTRRDQASTRMVTINTSGTATLTVTTFDNSVDEPNGVVTAAVIGGAGYSAHNTAHTASVTVNDNDPVVSLSGGMPVTEGTAATFTLTASSAPDSDISVTVTVTDSGVFAGGGQTGERTVTIPAGNTSATLTVATLDDTTDEPNGAITATVTGGIGYSVHNTAHTASVTVNDNDAATSMERALPAWLARFGRTVTDQVLEAVTDRLAAPRSPGMTLSLAGRALPIRGQNNAGSLRTSLAERGAGALALQSWSPTGRDLTFGTSFALTGEPRADGSLLSVWGRGALSHFAGRDGGLALDGEAQTLLVGAERAGRGWTTGGVLGRSRVEGGYRSATGTGEIEATLTGVYPWAGQAVNDQVSAWAALGYGAGDLTFQPKGGDPVRTDLSLALGAVGLRGEVLRPLQAGGLSLAVKGDVRVTRTSSKAAGDTLVGRLMAAEADVWRVRAGVEGARSFMANDDPWATVTPSFEVGIRLDGGDAETGFGADVGGGVALVDPGRGVTLEMKARGLAAHEDEGFREWGASAALVWEPRPQSGRGLSLSLTQSWGASSSGGMDALLSRDTLVGLAASDTAPAGRRLEAELGYAMTAFGGDFTATPNAGLTLTEDGRDWRLGWRLTPAWPDGSGFDVNLDATRSETGDETPAHAVTLRGALRF